MANENKNEPFVDVSFDYTDSYGDVEKLYPTFSMYRDFDTLYLGFYFYNEDEDPEFSGMEPYCTATVNLRPLPFLHSAIDTNNNGIKMLDFLEKNGFGHRTGQGIPSGYCVFPVFEFNADKIKELDPNFYEFYAKTHGVDIKKEASIDSKIQKAANESEKQMDNVKIGDKENFR